MSILGGDCFVEDGDRFLLDYIKPDNTYVIGACDPTMQRKMFKDAFAQAGGDYEKQAISLDLRNLSTEEAFQKVASALEQLA